MRAPPVEGPFILAIDRLLSPGVSPAEWRGFWRGWLSTVGRRHWTPTPGRPSWTTTARRQLCWTRGRRPPPRRSTSNAATGSGRTWVDTRSTDVLLAALDRITTEGWDGPTACELLRVVRARIVVPLVVASRLQGAAAEQAEASGWERAWEVLSRPSLREARHPWSVLWVAVRHAVRDEVAATVMQTSVRAAWRFSPTGTGASGETRARVDGPVSLEALPFEPLDDSLREPTLGGGLGALADTPWRANGTGRALAAPPRPLRSVCQPESPTLLTRWPRRFGDALHPVSVPGACGGRSSEPAPPCLGRRAPLRSSASSAAPTSACGRRPEWTPTRRPGGRPRCTRTSDRLWS